MFVGSLLKLSPHRHSCHLGSLSSSPPELSLLSGRDRHWIPCSLVQHLKGALQDYQDGRDQGGRLSHVPRGAACVCETSVSTEQPGCSGGLHVSPYVESRRRSHVGRLVGSGVTTSEGWLLASMVPFSNHMPFRSGKCGILGPEHSSPSCRT